MSEILEELSPNRQITEKTIRNRLRNARAVARTSVAICAGIFALGDKTDGLAIPLFAPIPVVAATVLHRRKTHKNIKQDVADYQKAKMFKRNPMIKEELSIRGGDMISDRAYDIDAIPREESVFPLFGMGSGSEDNKVSIALNLQQFGAYGTTLCLSVIDRARELHPEGGVELDNLNTVMQAPTAISALALVSGTMLDNNRFEMGPYMRQLDNIDGPQGVSVP